MWNVGVQAIRNQYAAKIYRGNTLLCQIDADELKLIAEDNCSDYVCGHVRITAMQETEEEDRGRE